MPRPSSNGSRRTEANAHHPQKRFETAHLGVGARLWRSVAGGVGSMRVRADGQSLVDYVILVSVLLAGAVGFQHYVKRGLAARYKTLSDGAMEGMGAAIQYEPYYLQASSNQTQDQQRTVAYQPGGNLVRTGQELRATDPGATQTIGVNLTADDDW